MRKLLAPRDSSRGDGCGVGMASHPAASSGFCLGASLSPTPLSNPRTSFLAPVPFEGLKARALPAGAPCRAPSSCLRPNPSFAQAGLGPEQ